MNITRLAAIDIGANSVKLLISDILNYDKKVISKKLSYTRIPLRLGEDTFKYGYITQEKIDKLILLLQAFNSFKEINEAKSMRICATSALREASNGEEIVEQVFNKVNIKIEILTPQDEAKLLLNNVFFIDQDQDTMYFIVDVGGGCTDIALSLGHNYIETAAFNLGTIRTLPHDEYMKEWANLKAWLEDKRQNHRKIALIGSGGNINKINSLHHRRGEIKRLSLTNLYTKFREMSIDERVATSDFGYNRAEVILPAIKIYLQILKILKVDKIQIPMVGLADGIINDMYLNRE